MKAKGRASLKKGAHEVVKQLEKGSSVSGIEQFWMPSLVQTPSLKASY